MSRLYAPTDWPLAAAAVWIATRDEALADEAASAEDPLIRAAILYEANGIDPIEMAPTLAADGTMTGPEGPIRKRNTGPRLALRHALRTEQIVAFGIRDTGTRTEPIPAREWADRTPGYDDHMGPWSRVRIPRADVIAAFPKPSTAQPASGSLPPTSKKRHLSFRKMICDAYEELLKSTESPPGRNQAARMIYERLNNGRSRGPALDTIKKNISELYQDVGTKK